MNNDGDIALSEVNHINGGKGWIFPFPVGIHAVRHNRTGSEQSVPGTQTETSSLLTDSNHSELRLWGGLVLFQQIYIPEN